mmetsp:Transcript_149184/g.271138  ORF Transcript_149184/g.271138 Transcript_149184/m.271138 type:complete len:126 (-) Transcript_149184:2267-2644(-)
MRATASLQSLARPTLTSCSPDLQHPLEISVQHLGPNKRPPNDLFRTDFIATMLLIAVQLLASEHPWRISMGECLRMQVPLTNWALRQCTKDHAIRDSTEQFALRAAQKLVVGSEQALELLYCLSF